MPRYKKGELVWLKGFSPEELVKYVKDFPNMEKSVENFKSEYEYIREGRLFKWKKRRPIQK